MFSHLFGLSSPRGCSVLVKNRIFRLLTSQNDGFKGLAVIMRCFHVDPGAFQRKARHME